MDNVLAREVVSNILPETEMVLQKYTNLLLEEYRLRLENAQTWEEAKKAQGAIETIKRISKVRQTALTILKG